VFDTTDFRVFFNPYRYGVLAEQLVKEGIVYFNTKRAYKSRNSLTAEKFRNQAA
jgi:hypothetical protein